VVVNNMIYPISVDTFYQVRKWVRYSTNQNFFCILDF
jgi:hypothetical protein